VTRTLAQVEQALGAETLDARKAAADCEAAMLDEVLERARTGASRSAALREVFPDRPVSTMLRRVRDYAAHGRDALISRRYPPAPELKMTPDVRGGLRVLAQSDASAGAEILAERLSAMFGVSVSTSSVQQALQELGLARPRGRPWWRSGEPPVSNATVEIESLSLAGAELLKAVDEACGAVAALTAAIGERLSALPAPVGPVVDDRAGRDDHGRFLASYNEPDPRIEPELGSRFNSVSEHRQGKDLRQMRVAEESPETRHRKNLGLVLLPCVVRGSRWSALQHWRGNLLGELIGYDYQASTYDKYLRELKLAGVVLASRGGPGRGRADGSGSPVRGRGDEAAVDPPLVAFDEGVADGPGDAGHDDDDAPLGRRDPPAVPQLLGSCVAARERGRVPGRVRAARRRRHGPPDDRDGSRGARGLAVQGVGPAMGLRDPAAERRGGPVGTVRGPGRVGVVRHGG